MPSFMLVIRWWMQTELTGSSPTAGWLLDMRGMTVIVVAALVAIPAFHFMPQKYYDRIATIEKADTDASFQGRVTAWKEAFFIARDRFPFGAGLNGPQEAKVFNRYFPGTGNHAAHSIFFQVLGDAGFIGLAIYLVILTLIFRYCAQIRRSTRASPELRWAYDLTTAIQLSMVAFCVAGAALSLAYSDFVFIWAGLLPALARVLQNVQPKQVRFRATRFDRAPQLAGASLTTADASSRL